MGFSGVLETAISPILGSPESASTPNGSPERGKLGLEAGGRCQGGLETATGRCWEQSKNGKRRLEPKGGLETAIGSCSEQSPRGKGRPEAKGGLETTTSSCSEQSMNGKRRLRPKGGLETTNGSSSEQNTSGKGRPEPRGRLETPTRSENGGLEPTPEPEGSLETATTPKGGLETATTGCPEENGEAKGQKKPGPEDCAVIWLGEEEEEEEEADEGPGRYLAALEAVQLELEAVEEEAARAFRRLRAKFGLRRRPHLQRRNHLIQNIPGFWVTTVSFLLFFFFGGWGARFC